LLSDFGIRFIVIQHTTGSKIDGAAFWLDERSPVIAFSGRFDRVNYFWHTVAHELSHIYHNDADIDSDSFEDNSEEDSETERRANQEAAATFIDQDELKSFTRRTAPMFTSRKIIQFANRHGVHPSIVLGNLQFQGHLDWSQGAKLQTKYRDHLISVALTDGWGHSLPPFK
jgi:HTH-type transcriptional regulator/antitoxin HigA